MRSRLDDTFLSLRESGRAGFIAYLTAGDPSPALTVPLALECAARGVDVLELGVPFSDPLADGVVNQRASERALRHGVTLRGVLDLVAGIRRKSEIPIVLFTYLNPLFSYGFGRFAADAARAGVDGVLSLDLPPEEAAPYEASLRKEGLQTIFLVAPTTQPDRLRLIARHARGFIYCVSRMGVTGARTRVTPDLEKRIRGIRLITRTPVAVGFGISTPEDVAAVARLADAVVVGSAFVREIESHGGEPGLVKRIGRKISLLSAPLREGKGKKG
jgi:tryptophan synthase alpha chain